MYKTILSEFIFIPYFLSGFSTVIEMFPNRSRSPQYFPLTPPYPSGGNGDDDNENVNNNNQYTMMSGNQPISPLSDDDDGRSKYGPSSSACDDGRSKYGPPSSSVSNTYADVGMYDPSLPALDAYTNRSMRSSSSSKDQQQYHHPPSFLPNSEFPYPPRTSYARDNETSYHQQRQHYPHQQRHPRHRHNTQYGNNNKRSSSSSFVNYSSSHRNHKHQQNNDRRNYDLQTTDNDRVDVSRFIATYFQGPIQTVDVERPFQYIGTRTITHSTSAKKEKSVVFSTRLMIEMFFERANTLRDISIGITDTDDVEAIARETTTLRTSLSVRTVSSPRRVLWQHNAEGDIATVTDKLAQTFDFTNPIPLFAFDDSLEIVLEFSVVQPSIATTTDDHSTIDKVDDLLKMITDNPPSVEYVLTAYGTLPSAFLIENTSVRVHSVPNDFYCKGGKLT